MKKVHTKKKIAVLAFYVNQVGNVTDKYFGPGATYSMASDRLQLMPALLSAIRLGYDIEIFSLHSPDVESIINVKEYGLCLIAKMNANTNSLIQAMISANMVALNLFKKNGCKIIALYCDNLMHSDRDLTSDNNISKFYKYIFKLSNFIIFPSKKMKELSHQYAKSEAKEFVICDPWQLKSWHTPKVLKRNKNCRLIWFGNNKNISYLLEVLPSLISASPKKQNFLLTILSTRASHKLVQKWIENFSTPKKNWRVRFPEWDTQQFSEQLEAEISNSHISILPSNPTDPLKAGVSHNRLVDSIRGGCVTIASPMQSYKELSNLALIRNNLGEALNEALENYQQLGEHLQECRVSELDQFSPNNNAHNWDKCWKTILQLD